MITNVVFRLIQAIEFADIENVKVWFHQSYDMGAVADAEVEVDDAELIRETIHEREQTGREAMNAAKRKGMKRRVKSSAAPRPADCRRWQSRTPEATGKVT